MAMNVGTLTVDISANLASFSKGMSAVGKRIGAVSRSMQGLGLAATAASASLVLIGREAVQAFGAVEGAVNNALTLTTAQGEEFQKMQRNMTRTATRLSTQLGFSASQIATGFYDVLSTGAKAMSPQFNELAETALTMAKVVGLAPSAAIEGLSDTLKAFGLDLTDANRAAEVFFVTSRQAATTVPQLVDAMRDAAPAANAAGVSINDTAAILAAFAETGTKGAVAGTSFRQILLRLAAAPADAKKALKELNVEIFETDGTMRNILDIIEDLQGATAGLSDEQRNATLKALAGEEAFSRLAALMSANVDGMREWSRETKKGGTLQGALAIKLSGVAEQMNLFKIQITNAAASLGRDLLPVAKKVMSTILGLIRWFQKLTPSVRQTAVEIGVWVAGLGAAAAGISGLLFVLGPLVAAFGSLLAFVASAIIPFALLAVGLVGIIALFGALRIAWQENLGGIQEIVASVSKFVIKAWGFILDVADFAATSVRDGWLDAFEAISTAVLVVKKAVASAFQTMAENAIKVIAGIADFGLSALQVDVSELVDTLAAFGVPESLIKGIREFDAGIDKTRKSFETMEKAGLSAGEVIFGAIEDDLSDQIKEIGKAISDLKKDTVGEDLKQGIQKALAFLEREGPGAVEAAFSGIKDALASAFDALPDEVKDFLRNALEKVKGFEFVLPQAGVGGGKKGETASQGATVIAEEVGREIRKANRETFTMFKNAMSDFGKGAGETAGALIQGKLATVLDFGKKGAAAGGIAGAVAGVSIGLLSLSKQFTKVIGTLDGIIQAAADLIGAVIEPLIPILGAVGILVTSVLGPLGPLLEAVGQLLAPIAPLLVMLAQFLSLVLAPLVAVTKLFEAIAPVYEAAFKVIFALQKQYIIGILKLWIFIVDVVNGIVGFFTGIVSKIFEQLAKAARAIGLKGVAKKLDQFASTVEDVGFSTEGAQKKLEETRAMTFGSAMQAAADAAEGFGDSVEDATSALLNVPEGFKLAAARFDALDPGQRGEGGGDGGLAPQVGTIMIETVAINTPTEPEDFIRRLLQQEGLVAGIPTQRVALFAAEGE